ncbi:MAG: FAD-dependent oxidoreductase [Gallionellales bacterium RIFCSPLOWO2_12_FULL_59_22]|nr:MAG: FAD-dependent oxidoreductase [Gallionellales bacterium RIFCSPLOWO2_02_FULL_59_110]OGT02982.1 MAG: FAD-dependent oxidoreductase [Gallionellales bacterium RIFCSPLOWO2_02_58_13]OGT11659.1 MAG: FAD-dependent oxidoreductase [Gallionellales bacterium RIFCSPLOWO2_12_FULL_59_22]
MNRNFSSLTNKQFDLLVCGGGIYGAWTAYDAALRGLSVALVEQGDWAGATSSASSKLIHGGLRYLESLDFKLVKKALAERQMLLSVAPHRVWPLRFGLPVYADSRVGTFQLRTGLSMYDFLAENLSSSMVHRRFDKQAFAGRFPFLAEDGLKGGFTYGDAQTDDARLVLELVSGAMAAGAVCVNYCRLTGMTETDGRVSGATVQDMPYSPFDELRANGTSEVRAKQIVNATGQWTAASEQGRGWCRLDKGTHLVMPALPTDEALLLTAKSDGRVFFMIPWYGMTLLGTTDADYGGDLDRVAVEPEEVAYLLAEANRYLKTAWAEKDVVGSYAGLRVMKCGGAASPAAASRDWELKTAGNGAHYSIGGKLTSAREDAACIVDTVCAQLGIDKPCATRSRAFPWAPEEDYASWFVAASTQAARHGIDQESAKWLMRRHGKRVNEVFRIVEDDPRLAERILPALPFIHADLLFCARDEMAVHLGDLLRRRMPLLILAKLDEGDLRRLAKLVADAMGWDEAALNREI